ncbi:hypothetical protein [Catalinimonas alkaloidigena]|uniref:hypothetical protein n=1 Tax=Catalinimonas alkaloidigena TaxID=1075417 RepID=UPI000B7FBC45|nr:hypothetical protein [Catalinimonas alkaloidigena]
MTLDQAKEKVLQAIKDNPVYSGEHRVDENRIIETDFAWYIPFVNVDLDNQPLLAGAYQGFIVGRINGDLHQPGSGFSLDTWMIGFKLGLLNGPYDLIITKINDLKATKDLLKKLELQYFNMVVPNVRTAFVRI